MVLSTDNAAIPFVQEIVPQLLGTPLEHTPSLVDTQRPPSMIYSDHTNLADARIAAPNDFQTFDKSQSPGTNSSRKSHGAKVHMSADRFDVWALEGSESASTRPELQDPFDSNSRGERPQRGIPQANTPRATGQQSSRISGLWSGATQFIKTTTEELTHGSSGSGNKRKGRLNSSSLFD
jgi:hypothetical protein